jgi:hypothetical protein
MITQIITYMSLLLAYTLGKLLLAHVVGVK